MHSWGQLHCSVHPTSSNVNDRINVLVLHHQHHHAALLHQFLKGHWDYCSYCKSIPYISTPWTGLGSRDDHPSRTTIGPARRILQSWKHDDCQIHKRVQIPLRVGLAYRRTHYLSIKEEIVANYGLFQTKKCTIEQLQDPKNENVRNIGTKTETNSSNAKTHTILWHRVKS
jgi:hypothetical protein